MMRELRHPNDEEKKREHTGRTTDAKFDIHREEGEENKYQKLSIRIVRMQCRALREKQYTINGNRHTWNEGE